ncbi:MAG: hypothetical protein WBJ13_01610 [Sedimentibacter sp.]
MKAFKKTTIFVLIIIFISTLFIAVPSLLKNYFNKFGNYFERGLGSNNILNTETSDIMENINTILENEDYGTLVIKKRHVLLLSGYT